MNTEIEVKFLDISIDDTREKLKAASAVCEQPMRLMRRALIEQPEHRAEHAWLRIRDEGDKTTLTFKRRKTGGKSIDDTKEIEVVVSDFETTVELFKEAGWSPSTYQETKRETWRVGDTEVTINQWPWLPPEIEVEGPTEGRVREVAEMLGYGWNDAFYGHIDDVYQLHYTFVPNFRGVIDLESDTKGILRKVTWSVKPATF